MWILKTYFNVIPHWLTLTRMLPFTCKDGVCVTAFSTITLPCLMYCSRHTIVQLLSFLSAKTHFDFESFKRLAAENQNIEPNLGVLIHAPALYYVTAFFKRRHAICNCVVVMFLTLCTFSYGKRTSAKGQVLSMKARNKWIMKRSKV